MRFVRFAVFVAVWLQVATASAQVVTTAAGSGTQGYNGDDPTRTALTAQLNVPVGIAVDSAGNLYIADSSNHIVRKVTPAGVITTIAGTPDTPGGDATHLGVPTSVAVDGVGNVYIADTFNHRIQRVAAGTGTVTTVAGTGSLGTGGDGIAATSSALNYPYGVAVDSSNNLYIADTHNHRIRKVIGGNVFTIAGTAAAAGCDDTHLNFPRGLSVAASGDVFIADSANHRVMKLSGSTMSIFAGAGDCSSGLVEGNATLGAKFNVPAALAITPSNDVLVADSGNSRIRRVRFGTVATVAGSTQGFTEACGPATSAQFNMPRGVASIPGGETYYVSDYLNHRVRKVANGAPCPPTLDSAGGGNNQASLAFTAGYDGGAAITGFNASCTPGPLTGTGTASPVTVTGMTNGTQYTCTVTATNAAGTSPASNSVTVTPGLPAISFSQTTVDLGGTSMSTTSPVVNVTVTNNGAQPFTISSLSAPNSQFGHAHDCNNIAGGATCTIAVNFTPAISSGTPLGGTVLATTNLSVASNANGSPHSITLVGTAEKSLVTHYYRSILRRNPDSGGKSFWTGEAQRVAALPANVSEAWFALAQTFFGSPEYAALNRTNSEFVTDLYVTFFNRQPDSGGLNYWLSEMTAGSPRDVLLAAFMFSAEFVSFTNAIFGNTAVRPERDVVMDFYRGMLGRLPDDGGFTFWVNKFRAAQCNANAAAAVRAEVESISASFLASGEYLGRNRPNAQFVSDMYNSFLRRGGESGGVNFWINEVNTGARTRDRVRQDFLGSAEFNVRVNAIINAGCQQ